MDTKFRENNKQIFGATRGVSYDHDHERVARVNAILKKRLPNVPLFGGEKSPEPEK